MQLLISDASILIDIENGNLTSTMFSLPYQFAVPDILFEEELSKRHSHLLEFGLMNKEMGPDLISEAYNLRQKFFKTSVNDLLALTLARDVNSPLLTGDKALRKVAKIFNIEVHGTIWLVERMIYYKKISTDVAQIAFQRMKETGSRLPWNEIEAITRKDKTLQGINEYPLKSPD